MSISITSAFDSGNIEVTSATNPQDITLTIAKDAHSEFFQWFHFRLSGAKGQPCALHITGLQASAYPGGWPGYSAAASHDRQTWVRAPSSYADGTLTIHITPQHDHLWLAYFAPYTMEQHHSLIARMATQPGVMATVLGHSLEGQSIDCLTMGQGPLQCWLYARQHPGETMAEWWMEGALEFLTDPENQTASALRTAATFHCIPNMNPDGSRSGHLRTNAAGINLNREWANPTLESSPEVLAALTAMQKTGVDFAIDVHGDEAIPQVFIAGFEGIPAITQKQLGLLHTYKSTLESLTPDFQTRIGYPPSSPGRANLTMSTNQIANRFGCLAMTLEMPFKDHDNNHDPAAGWSPARSKALAHSCLEALAIILPTLR